ncbi:MAG: hypothetical protein HGA75_06180 [Thiobacillus sp.]|nr:hypothetical protein [Thiobacillus sp.]
MPTSLSTDVDAKHREVQRKFGRNLLLLQQYELLLKNLATQQQIAGIPDELRGLQEQRTNEVARKTLGQVVSELTEGFISKHHPSSESEENEQHPDAPTQPWFSISVTIKMEEGDFNQTKQRLTELVTLRNELVHHFLEKFDIWTESGCLAAGAYLDEGFKQIDAQFKTWREMANQVSELRCDVAAMMHTPEFRDFLTPGIQPSGDGVLSASCTIVELLREAESSFAQEGWTRLQQSIDHIRERAPKHTPKRYGCKTWRQVLHESRQFDIRREPASLGRPAETWYRSRAV